MQKEGIKEKLPTRYKNVASVISVGKAQAILLDDLISLTGIKDKRHAYEIIEQLIVKHGYPIIASRSGEHKGYYFPENERELEEAKTTLKNTIKSLKKRYNSLINNFETYKNNND